MALVYEGQGYWIYRPAPDPAGDGVFWQASDDSLAVYTQEYAAPEEEG